MTDFHYQDQSDRPEDITEEDYQHRREVWDDLFEQERRPGYAGFVWNLLGDSDIMKIWCDVQK
jgi:hypothetical protein